MAKRRKTPTQSKKETCFTIMPFGGWFDTYYAEIYVPAIEAADLVPQRADDLYRPSAIVHDIWSYTKDCRLILADLSDKNPNVFYELGLAHALAKPAILLTQSMDDVPFDLRALRVIHYDKNAPRWAALLKGKITTAIVEVLAAPHEAVLPTFLNVKGTDTSMISADEKQVIAFRQELDLIRNELQAVRSLQEAPNPPGSPTRTMIVGKQGRRASSDGRIEPRQLYSAEETAVLLSVRPATVKEYARRGILHRATKAGPRKEWRIRGSSIIELRERWGLS